jgi:uncharacterized linocin/CFP29 family protein
MNNLHRELAPVSDEAWAQIEQEASRTARRYLAGRRVVDLEGPSGDTLSAVGTGRIVSADQLTEGVQTWQREAIHLIQLRAPFTLSRAEIDAVARGAQDADWDPVRDAAREIALAEDLAIFSGYPAAGINGIVPGATNDSMPLPVELTDYPAAIAAAIGELRSAGVDGPYTAVLSADVYTALSQASSHGYPVIQHVRRLLDGEIVWAPAISGAIVLTMRGGDFVLHLGQDLSIGYLSHTDAEVTLYLQESMTFQLLAGEAAVPLTASKASRSTA